MKVYQYFVLFLLVVSCVRHKDHKQPIETLKIANAPQNNKLFLSKLCSEIGYVPLDTSKDIFVSASNKMQIADSLFYLMENYGVKRFSAYNIYNGKLAFEIAEMGFGPNEIGSPVAFYPNLNKKEVEIFDAMKRKLFRFDFQGHFINSKSIPFWFYNFTKDKAGNYFLFTSNQSNEGISSNLIITDSAFNIKRTFFELNPGLERLSMETNRNFVKYGDKLFFINSPDNYLYEILDYKIIPILKLDFNENNIPEKLIQNEAVLELSEWINILKEKKYSMGINGYFENKGYRIMQFLSFKELAQYYIFYDKHTKLYNYYSELNLINDIDNGITGKIIHLDDEQLVMFIEPYKLIEHINKSKNDTEFTNEKLLDFLKKKGENSNPILMFCKLKV